MAHMNHYSKQDNLNFKGASTNLPVNSVTRGSSAEGKQKVKIDRYRIGNNQEDTKKISEQA
jgi:hypothetical protein